ncbi:hypothetical protein ACFWXO_08440 [Kitasatospora sp. NPDC059088]|uniref:hypothetical protein n=1 Tax=Kitasatospora sp. NPDC059088 TaxID=3346722 RepID=UPI00369BA362
MTHQEQYTLYRQEAKLLAAVGERVHHQVGRVTVRLPAELARAAMAAWERDDEGELGEETWEEREQRDQAGELALIGLALTEDGRHDGGEVVVDLHVSSAGAAFRAYIEAAGPAFRQTGPAYPPPPQPDPDA